MKKIYKITFNECTYDQFDSFIVLAENEEDVISIVEKEYPKRNWADIDWDGGFKIEEIDFKGKSRILLGSFNTR